MPDHVRAVLRSTVQRLVEQGDDVSAVVLVGTARRGGYIEGDDIDLAVVHRFRPELHFCQDWKYVDGVPVDVRHLSAKSVRQILFDAPEQQQIAYLSAGWPADYIHGFRVVHLEPHHGKASISLLRKLLALRRDQHQAVVASGRTYVATEVERLKRQPLPTLDEHHELRRLVNYLVVPSLQAVGWWVHASKRLPEELSAYVPQHPALRRLLKLQLSVMGLTSLSSEQANQLRRQRLDLRTQLIDYLRSDESLDRNAANELIEHESGAFDHYAAQCSGGYHRGAINHIRFFSGAARLPDRLERIREGRHVPAPVSTFVLSRKYPKHLVTTWLGVMELESDPCLVRAWRQDLSRLVAG